MRRNISITLFAVAVVFLVIITGSAKHLSVVARLNKDSIALVKTGVYECAPTCIEQSPLSVHFAATSDIWAGLDANMLVENQCNPRKPDTYYYHRRLAVVRGLQLIFTGQPLSGQDLLMVQLNEAVDPWQNLIAAAILLIQKQYRAAMGRWQCATPFVETYLIAVADSFFQDKDYENYERALNVSLRYSTMRSSRVVIYRKLGGFMLYQRKDPKAAIPLLSEAIHIDRSEYLARVSLTHALLQIGQYDQALIHGNIALEQPQASKDRPLERARVLRMIGNSYLGLGNYPKAFDALKESLDLDPNSQWGHLSMALLYEKLGKPELAEKERLIAETLSSPATP